MIRIQSSIDCMDGGWVEVGLGGVSGWGAPPPPPVRGWVGRCRVDGARERFLDEPLPWRAARGNVWAYERDWAGIHPRCAGESKCLHGPAT